MNLDKWAQENGYVVADKRPDGVIVAVLQGVANGQIILGDEYTVTDRYSYAAMVDAFVAFAIWRVNGYADEPENWIRHQPSNRRRVDGDPAHEEVRP